MKLWDHMVREGQMELSDACSLYALVAALTRLGVPAQILFEDLANRWGRGREEELFALLQPIIDAMIKDEDPPEPIGILGNEHQVGPRSR